MNNYCTYFDSNYLPQGLAMADSLLRYDANGVLWVLALDAAAGRIIGQLGLPNVRVVRLEELLASDASLAEVRQTRSGREFIFTITACWILHLLSTRGDMERIAYIDADMFFFGDPCLAWAERRGASVLITEHRYPEWHDDSARYGRFNVGWLAFGRDPAALGCLRKWREQCLASCSLAADGRSFGDQLYLDDWPGDLDGALAVSAHPGVNVAPWNWAGVRCEVNGEEVTVRGLPLVLFHFAQFKRVTGRWWDSGQLEYGVMPRGLRTAIYRPYIEALEKAAAKVREVEPEYELREFGWRASLGAWHLAILRLLFGQFWWRSGNGSLVAGRLGLGRWSGHVLGFYRRWQQRRV
jgi:hypothetical protein